MALRAFEPFTSDWHAGGGNPAGRPRTTQPDHHARGHLQRPWADAEAARRQQAAPSSVGAALRAAAREVRETLGGVVLIVGFSGFVAAILVTHHFRRLWPGAATREVWRGGRLTPPGRNVDFAPARRSSDRGCG